MIKTLILLGSHRNPSDTLRLLDAVFSNQQVTLANLLETEIAPYDYAAIYPEQDKFLQVVEQLLAHDRIVFATPVYWYAMSGRMKNFFDRLTGLVTTHKQFGRQLREKVMLVLAVGADATLPDGFLAPFTSTAIYFDMYFRGYIYACSKHPAFPAQFPEESRLFRQAALA